jgi:tetratricopeptide (TPR) repeat protein
MTRVAAFILVVLCAAALWGAERRREELKAISAAEAERRISETRDFLTDLLWENTEQYWHEGQWEECIRLCRQIVELDPQFIEAYTGAAFLLYSLDRDEEAVELYEAGVKANPDRYDVYQDFGLYYMYRKKWLEAAEQFRKAAERDAPQHFQHMLPRMLERAGKEQEALDEWRALLKRFPGDVTATHRIEALEKELAEESPAEPGQEE